MVNERLIRNKKGVLPRTWVIATILFVTVVALLYTASNGFLSEYSQDSLIDSDFNNSYNKYNELTGSGDMNISATWESMTDDKGWNVFDTLIGIPAIFMSVIRYLAGSVGIMSDVPSQIGEDLGVDSSIVNILGGSLILLISVVIIFAIISSVSRSNRI